MTLAEVHFRDYLPPHASRATVRAKDIRYAHMLNRATTASFSIPRSDPSLTSYGSYMGLGAFVTIQRTDGLLSWAGWVDNVKTSDTSGQVVYRCGDHAKMLFNRSRVPPSVGLIRGPISSLMPIVYRATNDLSRPPLMSELAIVGRGTTIDYTARQETFLAALKTLTKAAGLEWTLMWKMTEEIVTRLVIDARIGRDVRGNVKWEQGLHFNNASYTQDAEGFAVSAVVVGGTGSFNSRPTGQADRTIGPIPDRGKGGDTVLVPQTRRAGPVGPTAVFGSPALETTRIDIEPGITNETALADAAQALFRAPDFVAEQLSFSLVESEVDLDYVQVGNIVSIRLSDMALGAGLERDVRILGLQPKADIGTIDVELEVLRSDR